MKREGGKIVSNLPKAVIGNRLLRNIIAKQIEKIAYKRAMERDDDLFSQNVGG